MNGAMPQVAVEYGRKTISAYERPTIDEVEAETVGGGSGGGADQEGSLSRLAEAPAIGEPRRQVHVESQRQPNLSKQVARDEPR